MSSNASTSAAAEDGQGGGKLVLPSAATYAATTRSRSASVSSISAATLSKSATSQVSTASTLAPPSFDTSLTTAPPLASSAPPLTAAAQVAANPAISWLHVQTAILPHGTTVLGWTAAPNASSLLKDGRLLQAIADVSTANPTVTSRSRSSSATSQALPASTLASPSSNTTTAPPPPLATTSFHLPPPSQGAAQVAVPQVAASTTMTWLQVEMAILPYGNTASTTFALPSTDAPLSSDLASLASLPMPPLPQQRTPPKLGALRRSSLATHMWPTRLHNFTKVMRSTLTHSVSISSPYSVHSL